VRILAPVVGLTCMVVSLSIGSAASSAEARPCTVVVEAGASLQAAIEEAQTGSVICLGPGAHAGPITISKPLTLRGTEGKTRILGSPGDSIVVAIAGSDPVAVRLENLEVEANTTYAIHVVGTPTVTLEGVGISKATSGGLWVEGAAVVTVHKCVLSESNGPNAEQSSFGWGVVVTGEANVDLEECLITENASGGLAAGSSKVKLTDCTLTGNEYWGLTADGHAAVTVARSRVSGNGVGGLQLWGQATLEVAESEVSDNRYGGVSTGSGPAALASKDAPSLSLVSSRLARNGVGIEVGRVTRVVAEGCEIVGNRWAGVSAFTSATVRLSACRIEGNEVGITATDTCAVTCAGCTISDNRWDGINVTKAANLDLRDSEILRNGGYGIRASSRACCPWEGRARWSVGEVTGANNLIPGRPAADANGEGTVCPGRLEFLRRH